MKNRLQIDYLLQERMNPMLFLVASLDAMQRQGFELPTHFDANEHPARVIAEHIRDTLKLPNCHLIHIEENEPPVTIAVFFRKEDK